MSEASKQNEDTQPVKRGYGAAIRTIVILALISLLVGLTLDVLGMRPLDFWRDLVLGIKALFEGFFEYGWGIISSVLSYIVLGAIIVVPVWLVIHLIGMRRR